MSTIFSKIVKGEIPCHKIMENDKFLAFLDICPIKPGHTLVIPKKEIDYIFDINDSLLSEFVIFAKQVAIKIKETISCERIGVMVCGIEIAHAHIHLVPINGISDMSFSLAKAASSEALSQVAKKFKNI